MEDMREVAGIPLTVLLPHCQKQTRPALKDWPGRLKVWPGSLKVWPGSLEVWPAASKSGPAGAIAARKILLAP